MLFLKLGFLDRVATRAPEHRSPSGSSSQIKQQNFCFCHLALGGNKSLVSFIVIMSNFLKTVHFSLQKLWVQQI
jgi:hypothetical protein